MADFADLIVPVDEDEILQQELNLLELQEFPVTAYQEGTVARTLLQAFANVQADAWFALAQIARGATLDTAEGSGTATRPEARSRSAERWTYRSVPSLPAARTTSPTARSPSSSRLYRP